MAFKANIYIIYHFLPLHTTLLISFSLSIPLPLKSNIIKQLAMDRKSSEEKRNEFKKCIFLTVFNRENINFSKK
ncbi:hypothetical protein [Flavobacterium suaedae]|uniref:hypothetical protein n=1 Tax=Flavobacterium suaedae TaxID=1767027 RepID=UPI00166D7263|nr:hypothetical protein [Flavobacterium suaedae]